MKTKTAARAATLIAMAAFAAVGNLKAQDGQSPSYCYPTRRIDVHHYQEKDIMSRYRDVMGTLFDESEEVRREEAQATRSHEILMEILKAELQMGNNNE